MLRLMVSAGMLAALALSTASRRRGLAERSPPPWRAATMISRMTRVHTLPRFSSWRPLRSWMFAHLLCPATEKSFSLFALIIGAKGHFTFEARQAPGTAARLHSGANRRYGVFLPQRHAHDHRIGRAPP